MPWRWADAVERGPWTGCAVGGGRRLQASLAQRRAIWPMVTASLARRRVIAQPGATAGTHRLAWADGATDYSADGGLPWRHLCLLLALRTLALLTIAGSPTGSQQPQAPGHARPRPAIL